MSKALLTSRIYACLYIVCNSFAGFFVLCGCVAMVTCQGITTVFLYDDFIPRSTAVDGPTIVATSSQEYKRIFTESSQIVQSTPPLPASSSPTSVCPQQDETSYNITASSVSQFFTTHFSSMVTSSLETSRTARVPSATTPTKQLATQISQRSSLPSLRSTITLLPSPSTTATISSSPVVEKEAESTAIVHRESTAIQSYIRSSYIVEASATIVGTAVPSAAPPHDHIATAPSPPKFASSFLDVYETQRPTDKDATEAAPNGYRDVGFAVASVVIAVVLLIGSVIAVSVVGLVMQWRDVSSRRGARGLDKRSDSFRYTHSY